MKNILLSILLISVWAGSAKTQSLTSSNSQNLIGRWSTGWNYYTKANSFAPQINSISNTMMLNYRIFDDSNRIQYQFKMDAYEKNDLALTKDSLNHNPFRNRYVLRQLYAAYGDNYHAVKFGRVIPMVTMMDAYPINGVSAENIRFLDRAIELSAFGGTINDEYQNKLAGTGYNFGAGFNFVKNSFTVGLGYTGENYYKTKYQKMFFYGDYRPFVLFRVTEKAQYVTNRSKLGYSITNLYYKMNKSLNLRLTLDYYDRSTAVATPRDTAALRSNNYFYTTKETNITAAATYHIFNNPDNAMDLTTTIKKRIGNGNLSYDAAQLYYRSYASHFGVGLDLNYTANQWLNNFKAGLSYHKDFVDAKISTMVSGAINSYSWNYTDSSGVKTKTNSRMLFMLTGECAYHFTRSFYTSFSLSEELGDASNAHSALFVRLNYYLR